MSNPRVGRCLRSAEIPLLVSMAVLLAAGCSKKADPAASATPSQPVATAPAAAPAADAQPAEAPPQQPSGPVLDTSQMVGDAKAAMAEADAAIRQREYEKA